MNDRPPVAFFKKRIKIVFLVAWMHFVAGIVVNEYNCKN
jgi:hypothetical protein